MKAWWYVGLSGCWIVLQAEEELLAAKMDKEYAGITGIPEFTKAAAELAFGADNQILKDGLVG